MTSNDAAVAGERKVKFSGIRFSCFGGFCSYGACLAHLLLNLRPMVA